MLNAKSCEISEKLRKAQRIAICLVLVLEYIAKIRDISEILRSSTDGMTAQKYKKHSIVASKKAKNRLRHCTKRTKQAKNYFIAASGSFVADLHIFTLYIYIFSQV